MREKREGYLWIRVVIPQNKLLVCLIIDCLNISWLINPLVHQGHSFSELTSINCCTSLDLILKKKLSCFEGEVVDVKHQESVVVTLCLDDVNPL